MTTYLKMKLVDPLGGSEPEKIEVSEIGSAKVHGYIMPSGAWCLYYSEGCVPCVCVQIKRKGQRKFRWIRKDYILEGFPA